jgi:hypothetical protein
MAKFIIKFITFSETLQNILQVFSSCGWELFLAMKKLRKILAWKEVLPGDLQIYDEAMIDYLCKRKLFKEQFERSHKKTIPLRPKNIWLLHGGRLAKEMGSLAHLDTQFGEQKNAQLKQFGQRAAQTKNVLLTVAQREKNFMYLKQVEKNSCGQVLVPYLLMSCADNTQQAVKEAISNVDSYNFYKKFKLFDEVFLSGFKCGAFYGEPREPDLGIIVTFVENKLSKQVYFVMEESTTEIVRHLDLLKIVPKKSYFLLKPSQIVLGKVINIYERKDHSGNLALYSASFF